MKNQENFSLKKRLNSFKYAVAGLRVLLKEEHNARVHVFAMIAVIALGFWYEISSTEWISLSFAIGFVIAMELVNSAIENIADFIQPEKDNAIKKIKDLAAGAVLISAITACVIGIIIFVPIIFNA